MIKDDEKVNYKKYLKFIAVISFMVTLSIFAYLHFNRSLPLGYKGEVMPTKMDINKQDQSEDKYFLENKNLILNTRTNQNFKLVLDSVKIKEILEEYQVKKEKNKTIVDFAGISLEKTTKKELHNQLKQYNAKKDESSSTNLLHIFTFNNAVIPYLYNAATFWGDDNNWTGLYLGLNSYNSSYQNLRSQLLVKYGIPSLIYYNEHYIKKNTDVLLMEKDFTGKAFWYKNNIVIEFSSIADNTLQSTKNNTEKNMNKIEYLRYIHLDRAVKMYNELHDMNK